MQDKSTTNRFYSCSGVGLNLLSIINKILQNLFHSNGIEAKRRVSTITTRGRHFHTLMKFASILQSFKSLMSVRACLSVRCARVRVNLA